MAHGRAFDLPARAATAGAREASLVVPLHALGRGGLTIAGGKRANLGELLRAGFPVPPGFVVTTAAYERFVARNDLDQTIARALREDDGAALRAAFEAAPIPPEMEREVLAAYEQLGQGPVAVRSSATAEDLPQAAFAGQQDTFLNVVGPDALLDAVRRCWASLWTDRAMAYRARQGIDHQTVKLAVVVQRMVPAEAAGVLFTANPVTGTRDEIVIDASPGLGEAVVSGLVTPDHFVLRRRWWGWHIAERRLGKREVVIRARSGGGTEHVEEPAAAGMPALPDRALRRLARLGKAIERHFGRPQDVEWAWAGGQPFIVQARPITALPEPLPRPSRLVRMMAGLVAELLPERPYPLEMTTWVPAVYGFLVRMVGLLGLRLLPLERVFIEEDGVVVRLRGELPVRPTPGVLLTPLRLLRLSWRHDPATWHTDPLLPEAEARVHALEARNLQQLSWEELLAMVHEVLAIPILVWEFRERYLVRPIFAAARLRLLLTLLGRVDLFGTLLFTGVETRTLAANRALEELAARIRSDPVLAETFVRHEASELWPALEAPETQPAGRAFLAALRTFLDEYGHREVGGTLQVARPTWKDAPELVLGLLQGMAQDGLRPQPQGQRPVRPAWEAARDDILRHPLLRLLSPVRSAFLRLLAEARYFPQLREDTRFAFMRLLPVSRRTLLELGRRLVEAGALDVPDDVFHLKLSELERIKRWPPRVELVTELRAIVAQRKAKRAALAGTPLVDPRLFGGAGAAAAGRSGDDVLLAGIPGGPGVAEGPVRVIHGSTEFGRLRPGEVLVAPYTNPAWTPLFQRAAAVVVDSGSAMSHAAIVAREYGIPAVMGTVDGTRRLVDGQRVRVDGSRGLVFRTGSQASHEGAAAVLQE